MFVCTIKSQVDRKNVDFVHQQSAFCVLFGLVEEEDGFFSEISFFYFFLLQ